MAGISAVLTAAGESIRMGQPKALLSWWGENLLQYQLGTLTQAGVSEIVVVLGHGALDLVSHARGERVRSVLNSDYGQGKTTSIKLGLRSINPGAEGVLLLAVDQPRTVDIVRNLIQVHLEREALITVPEYRGHWGHPVIFSARLLPELLAIDEASRGIRAILERHQEEVKQVSFETAIVRLDVNSLDEYQEAQRLFAQEKG